MPDPAPHTAAAQAAVAAALLSLGKRLDTASLLLTVAALLILGMASLSLPSGALLLLVVAAGVVEHIYALRTAFDAPIFAAWSRRWQADAADPAADLAAFDQALADNRLAPAPEGATRALSARIAGARRLLQRQGMCLLLQLAAWLGALAFILSSH